MVVGAARSGLATTVVNQLAQQLVTEHWSSLAARFSKARRVTKVPGLMLQPMSPCGKNVPWCSKFLYFGYN